MMRILIRKYWILFIRSDGESVSVDQIRRIRSLSTGVKIGIVDTPAWHLRSWMLIGWTVTNERLVLVGSVSSVQVLDDVSHVSEVGAAGRSDHRLHADHAAIRAALTLTHTRQKVRSSHSLLSLDNMTSAHLDTAGH